MKKTIFMAAIVSVILSAVLSCNKLKSDNWVAKIDDEAITVDDFNKMYYTQNKIMLNLEKDEIDKMAADPSALNPQVQQLVVKKSFLDQLVAQKLVYNKAMADEAINKEELKTIIEISKLQAVSQYYVSQKLKGKITVTDQETDKFYKENMKYFKGVPVDDNLIGKIKQQIFMEKAKLESNEIIMNLLAEAKVNKEGFTKYMAEQNKNKTEKPKESAPSPEKK